MSTIPKTASERGVLPLAGGFPIRSCLFLAHNCAVKEIDVPLDLISQHTSGRGGTSPLSALQMAALVMRTQRGPARLAGTGAEGGRRWTTQRGFPRPLGTSA